MKITARDIEAILWLLKELITLFNNIKKEKKNGKETEDTKGDKK